MARATSACPTAWSTTHGRPQRDASRPGSRPPVAASSSVIRASSPSANPTHRVRRAVRRQRRQAVRGSSAQCSARSSSDVDPSTTAGGTTSPWSSTTQRTTLYLDGQIVGSVVGRRLSHPAPLRPDRDRLHRYGCASATPGRVVRLPRTDRRRADLERGAIGRRDPPGHDDGTDRHRAGPGGLLSLR